MSKSCLYLLTAAVLASLWVDEDAGSPKDEKAALSHLQSYIGEWRGVGQPRRGSTRGAWREECGWAWSFADSGPSLTFKIKDAKYYSAGNLRWSDELSKYELVAESADDSKTTYVGELDEDGKLVLVARDSDQISPNRPTRISIRQVAGGDRLLMLYEKRSPANRYTRLAEVGYTRRGSGFGKGTNYVECVVTGGLGTIPVTYKGKTYYVCCTGCRDYFNDDPAGVLADYEESKKKEKEQEK